MSLTPDDEDLLGRARGGLGPSAADRARVRAAIGASLAGTSTLAAGAVATKSALLVKVVVGVVAVAALVGGSVALAPSFSSAGPPRAVGTPPVPVASVPVADPPPPSVATASAEPVAPSAPIVVSPNEARVTSAPHVPAVTARPRTSGAGVPAPGAPAPVAATSAPSGDVARPPETSTLAEETRLVSSAAAARRANDPRRALALLDEHAARFRRGVLAEERDAERVQALCAAGLPAEARDRAAAFAAAYPTSPLLATTRRACAGTIP